MALESVGGYGFFQHNDILFVPADRQAVGRKEGRNYCSSRALTSSGTPKPSLGFVPSTSLRSGRIGRAPGVPLLLCNASNRKSSVEEKQQEEQQEEVEEEEELSWVEEKVEDLKDYTSSAVRSIPGPRVGDGELPWLLALPIGYVAVSLVVAVVKTVRRYTSREGKRRRQVPASVFFSK